MSTTDLTDPNPTSTRHGAAAGPPRPLGPVGVWWRLAGAVLTVAAIAWATFNVVSLVAHEERTETDTYAAAGLTVLAIETDTGRVRVTASETDQVVVRTRISDGLGDSRRTVETIDGELQLSGSCPAVVGGTWCRVGYDVEVPRDLAVTIVADNGSVEVVGVAGALAVDADNGSIELRDVRGPVVASTDNGRVEATALRAATVRADSDNGRVELSFATAPTMVDARSDNGSVVVTVPDTGEAYVVTLDNDDGDQQLDVRVDPTSERQLLLSSDHGAVRALTAR